MTAQRNINNLRYADNTTLMVKSKDELKSPLMRLKEENENVGLKLNILKTKIMASSPNTSWQTEGEKVEAGTDFIFLGSKLLWMLTAAMKLKDTCSLKGSNHKPRQLLKIRDINLPEKVRIAKAMVFPAVTYRCESWTRKKAERQRIHAFELWCWRRLLTVPWTARRSNQSNLKEINPEYSLEGLMLMLELQNLGDLMQRADSLEKILTLGKIQGKR